MDNTMADTTASSIDDTAQLDVDDTLTAVEHDEPVMEIEELWDEEKELVDKTIDDVSDATDILIDKQPSEHRESVADNDVIADLAPQPPLKPNNTMSTSITSLVSAQPSVVQAKMALGTHFTIAVHSLLDSIADKDEQVRRVIEQSLGRTVEKRPNEGLMTICDYRIARPKMPEAQVALLMRVMERFTSTNAARIHIDPLHRLIAFTIAEITRSADHAPAIHQPGTEILVSLGRLHCDHVMDALCSQLHQAEAAAPSHTSGHRNAAPTAAHFMILHCMGALAVANQSGILVHLKPTLVAVLPTLGAIRLDHVRQAYATAIGRFAEAIIECSAEATKSASTEDQQQQQQHQSPPPTFDTEMAIAYDVFINQWVPTRDPKISADILQALAHMYALLPAANIAEQAQRTVQQLVGFYRRSMDRNAITQLLAAVLQATLDQNANALDAQFDPLCAHLFDLVCVSPDYERPQTVKGHSEVLRCFDRLFAGHGARVADMLLVQLRSNNERERIKSLLVLAHLCNKHAAQVRERLDEYQTLVRGMLLAERTHKMRMVLLKLVLALAQNGLLEDGECVRFLLRNSCGDGTRTSASGATESTTSNDGGAGDATGDAATELQQTCRNSLYIIVTSVPGCDELMKRELLRAFVRLEYTASAGTIAKCLGKLFGRTAEMPRAEEAAAGGADATAPVAAPAAADAIVSTNPETVFVRCLCLLGNGAERRRSEHILHFLKHFCPVLNRHLRQLWLLRIPELLADLDGRPAQFEAALLAFVQATIRDVDDYKFAEFLVLKLVQQLPLYSQETATMEQSTPASQSQSSSSSATAATTIQVDIALPSMHRERGMLLQLIGICVAYVSDGPMIDAMIDLILNAARAERFDPKQSIPALWQQRYAAASAALGYVARSHLNKVLAAVAAMLKTDTAGQRRTGAAGFLVAALPFLNSSARDAESARLHLLAIDAYRCVIQSAEPPQLLAVADTLIVPYLTKQLGAVVETAAANAAQNAKSDVTVARSVLLALRQLATTVLTQPSLLAFAH